MEQFEFLTALVRLRTTGVQDAMQQLNRLSREVKELSKPLRVKFEAAEFKAAAQEAKELARSLRDLQVTRLDLAARRAQALANALREANRWASRISPKLLQGVEAATPPTPPAPPPAPAEPAGSSGSRGGSIWSRLDPRRLFRSQSNLGFMPQGPIAQFLEQIGRDSLELGRLTAQLERMKRTLESMQRQDFAKRPAGMRYIEELSSQIEALEQRIRRGAMFREFAAAVTLPIRAFQDVSKSAAQFVSSLQPVQAAVAHFRQLGVEIRMSVVGLVRDVQATGNAIRNSLGSAVLYVSPAINLLESAFRSLTPHVQALGRALRDVSASAFTRSMQGAGIAAGAIARHVVPAVGAFGRMFAMTARLSPEIRAVLSAFQALGRGVQNAMGYFTRLVSQVRKLVEFFQSLHKTAGLAGVALGALGASLGLVAAAAARLLGVLTKLSIAMVSFTTGVIRRFVQIVGRSAVAAVNGLAQALISLPGSVARAFRSSFALIGRFNNYMRRIRFELLLAVNILGEQFREMALMVSPALILGDTVNKIAEFDDQITKTASNLEVFKDTNERLFNALGEEVRRAVLGTRFIATDGAEAVNVFAEAGFNTTQSLAALRPTLDLAASGFVSVEHAAEIAAGAIRQFGLDAVGLEDTTRSLQKINDIMVQAQLTGLSTVQNLGETFKAGGPIAQVAGSTIEEFSTLAVVLSRVGVVGPEAGTAIRRGFQRIATQPKDFQQAIERLNIDMSQFLETSGKFKPRGIIEFFKALRMSGADVESLTQIFGARSAQLAAIVDQAEDLDSILADIQLATRTNISQRIARQNEQSIRGVLDVARGAFIDLQIEFGRLFGPTLRAFSAGIVRFTERAKEFLNSREFLTAVRLFRERVGELLRALRPIADAFARLYAIVLGFTAGLAGDVIQFFANLAERLFGINAALRDSESFLSSWSRVLMAVTILATRGGIAFEAMKRTLRGIGATVSNAFEAARVVSHEFFANTLPNLVMRSMTLIGALIRRELFESYNALATTLSNQGSIGGALAQYLPRLSEAEIASARIGVDVALAELRFRTEEDMRQIATTAQSAFVGTFDPLKAEMVAIGQTIADEFSRAAEAADAQIERMRADAAAANIPKALGLDALVNEYAAPLAAAAEDLGNKMEPAKQGILAVLNTADQLRESLAGAAEIAEQIGGTKLGRLGSMLGDTSALRGLVASLGRGEAALIGISDMVNRFDPLFLDKFGGMVDAIWGGFLRGLQADPREPEERPTTARTPSIHDLSELTRRLAVAGSMKVEDRIARATERTAKATEEIAKKIDRNPAPPPGIAVLGP